MGSSKPVYTASMKMILLTLWADTEQVKKSTHLKKAYYSNANKWAILNLFYTGPRKMIMLHHWADMEQVK